MVVVLWLMDKVGGNGVGLVEPVVEPAVVVAWWQW